MRVVATSVIAASLAVVVAGCVSSHPPIPGQGKASPRLAARYNTEMAIKYIQQGEMDRAQRKLALARHEAPNDPVVLNALAFYYTQIGDYGHANREYRDALSVDPNSPDTLNNYGTFLCRRGRYRESLKYFVKAAGNLNYATPDAALANAGTCALKVPDQKLANRYFKRALALNPTQPVALWQLGLWEFENGHYGGANRYLGKLVTSHRHLSARVLWVAIETAWTVGEQKQARDYGRRLLKQYPKSPEAGKFIHLISHSK